MEAWDGPNDRFEPPQAGQNVLYCELLGGKSKYEDKVASHHATGVGRKLEEQPVLDGGQLHGTPGQRHPAQSLVNSPNTKGPDGSAHSGAAPRRRAALILAA